MRHASEPGQTTFLDNWAQLAAWIADQHPDLVIHTGDVTFDGAGVEVDLSYAARLMDELGIRWRGARHHDEVDAVAFGRLDHSVEDRGRRVEIGIGELVPANPAASSSWGTTLSRAKEGEEPMIVIQLSDPHILAPGELLYRRFDTAEFLARAVAEINRLDPLPDVAVVTGDLVDHGEPPEYEHLRALLAPLAMPVFVIPGNHDAREPLRAAFAADGYLPADGFLQYAIEDYPVWLIALDTLIPGEAGGLLCSERLAWLDHALASAAARPVLLMMHHPPFVTGIERMDRDGLQNTEALAAVVVRYPQIERILCGHLHRAIDCRFAGTVAGTAPSTGAQLRLDLTAEAPLRFMHEPPGYQLHVWREDSGLVTHTAVFGEWPDPHPFPAAS